MNRMIEYLEEYDIVYAKASGRITWDEIIKLSEDTFTVGREHAVNRFFIDCQDANIGLSVLEIDKLPMILKNTGFGQRDKIAILYEPSGVSRPGDSANGSLFTFLQNVAYLNSLQCKVFSNKDEAIYWLKSSY